MSSPSSASAICASSSPTRQRHAGRRRRRVVRHRCRAKCSAWSANPGAGKSLTGNAIIGLLEPPGRIAGGEICLSGERIDNLQPAAMRRIRGKRIGMVFQDPLTSLNPLYRIGEQLIETIATHTDLRGAAARPCDRADERGRPPRGRSSAIDNYPHQFSGGMRQRVVMALALAADPELVIADEPTTALDVSVQAQIITLLKRLCRRARHRDHADHARHGRDRRGRGPRRGDVCRPHRRDRHGAGRYDAPLHPYTVGLMGSIPKLDADLDRLVQIPGLDAAADRRFRRAARFIRAARVPLRPVPFCGRNCARTGPRKSRAGSTIRHHSSKRCAREARGLAMTAAPLVQAENLGRIFDVSSPWLDRVLEGLPRQFVVAVADMSFEIARNETLALVGESGSGKSTMARMVVGLIPPTTGEVVIDAMSMHGRGRRAERKRLRRRIQMVFQDPYASLDPRWRALDIIAEPIRAFDLAATRAEITSRVGELLRLVGLDPADGDKYPHQFSGGQRQRIAIARALASQPAFIVCDEPTSALDVSVQAQILNLMRDLQHRFGLTYLFISHNLAVVRHMAHRIGVMYLGPAGRDRRGGCIVPRAAPSLYAHAARCRARISKCPAGSASRSRARSPTRSIRPRAAASTRAVRSPTPAAAPSGRHWWHGARRAPSPAMR